MARDGTQRGGRRAKAGSKPHAAAEKIQKGKQVKVMSNHIPELEVTELHILQLHKDLFKYSFSNIEQQSLEFVKYTLDPWVICFEQAFNRRLLKEKEKDKFYVKFNVDGLLRGDYQSRMNGYAVGRQNGWMSANDIRALENLDRIPSEEGGDLYLINGMVPIFGNQAISKGNQIPC